MLVVYIKGHSLATIAKHVYLNKKKKRLIFEELIELWAHKYENFASYEEQQNKNCNRGPLFHLGSGILFKNRTKQQQKFPGSHRKLKGDFKKDTNITYPTTLTTNSAP